MSESELPEPETNPQGEVTASTTQVRRQIEGIYVCDVCDQDFASQEALDQHKLDTSH